MISSKNQETVGIPLFSSIYTQQNIEQSRRDDMISLGYILAYFLRGSLPWQGLKAQSSRVNRQRVLQRKQEITNAVLLRGYPSEFRQYLEYCSTLGFEDQPDYR